MRITHFHFLPSDDPFQYSETIRHITSIWYVHSDNHFQYIPQYIVLFIYQYLNTPYAYTLLTFQDDITVHVRTAYKHTIQHK